MLVRISVTLVVVVVVVVVVVFVFFSLKKFPQGVLGRGSDVGPLLRGRPQRQSVHLGRADDRLLRLVR